MSRIGKKKIALPSGVTAVLSGHKLSVKGPKGEISRDMNPDIDIKIEGSEITLSPLVEDASALWGTVGSHVLNMIEGVSKGFVKKLILEGIGYKAELKGNELVCALGFSHPVKIDIPADLKVSSEKGVIAVSGIDKERVGYFAAKVRDFKKPEPYKGKGFRYEGEIIQMKQGKKTV